MFLNIPHYRLPAATAAIRGVLEPRALYKREDTRRWWRTVFRIHKRVGHCVDADRPRAVKHLATALFSASH